MERKIRKLQDRSASLGNARGLVNATVSEFRVLEQVWDEFFELVLTTRVRALEQAIRGWARSRGLLGKPAQHRLPLVRVRSQENVEADFLRQQPPPNIRVKAPPSVISDIMNDLMSETRWVVGVRRAREYGLLLGHRVQWATFAPSNGLMYAGLDGLSARAIACDLGFDRGPDGTASWEDQLPLLISSYSSTDLDPRFPTMVEAWHPDSPNYYFMPAVDKSEWGLTRPWPERPPGSVGGRPEVVHDAPAVESLGAPILQAW